MILLITPLIISINIRFDLFQSKGEDCGIVNIAQYGYGIRDKVYRTHKINQSANNRYQGADGNIRIFPFYVTPQQEYKCRNTGKRFSDFGNNGQFLFCFLKKLFQQIWIIDFFLCLLCTRIKGFPDVLLIDILRHYKIPL